MVATAKLMCMIELCGKNLKRKYRTPKPVGRNTSSPSGNSGTPVRGKVPLGMRRRHKPGTKLYR
jgi:hypothetical protein